MVHLWFSSSGGRTKTIENRWQTHLRFVICCVTWGGSERNTYGANDLTHIGSRHPPSAKGYTFRPGK